MKGNKYNNKALSYSIGSIHSLPDILEALVNNKDVRNSAKNTAVNAVLELCRLYKDKDEGAVKTLHDKATEIQKYIKAEMGKNLSSESYKEPNFEKHTNLNKLLGLNSDLAKSSEKVMAAQRDGKSLKRALSRMKESKKKVSDFASEKGYESAKTFFDILTTINIVVKAKEDNIEKSIDSISLNSGSTKSQLSFRSSVDNQSNTSQLKPPGYWEKFVDKVCNYAKDKGSVKF